jgi:phage regulator Rha-like protein
MESGIKFKGVVNMKDLIKITNAEGREVNVIDSREVAEMMGETHVDIIQYLEGLKDKKGKDKVVGIIPTLINGSLQVSNYFIESAYKAGTIRR